MRMHTRINGRRVGGGGGGNVILFSRTLIMDSARGGAYRCGLRNATMRYRELSRWPQFSRLVYFRDSSRIM